jgi:hypothetical protein
VDQLTIEPVDNRQRGAAEPRCIVDDGVEDRLRVRLRTADRSENLTRRGLLIECLGLGTL